MKNFLLNLLLVGGLLVAGSTAAYAQGEPPEGGPEPDAPTDVPIDGGASLLLAAGAALGAGQLRRRKAQQ
ncbi:hypothetical protein FY528_03280 [Hymenobacter lutimineralis]|uniref:VPDSG-CTERM sorting domain-containing protein n=1 Tax=Hymenobacter lutimineralis TaxID=2606448 RepID=A0A5D6VFY8_9BACT|nr:MULTISPECIES: hypothetical protein [Hymenobacter]QIX61226.1 hypothetical protein HER32_08560 [Hymenobacter sp. BT18]TYZ13444.1 hypothetical protein FY528_03280 [Hymenobacter lutimineralis]